MLKYIQQNLVQRSFQITRRFSPFCFEFWSVFFCVTARVFRFFVFWWRIYCVCLCLFLHLFYFFPFSDIIFVSPLVLEYFLTFYNLFKISLCLFSLKEMGGQKWSSGPEIGSALHWSYLVTHFIHHIQNFLKSDDSWSLQCGIHLVPFLVQIAFCSTECSTLLSVCLIGIFFFFLSTFIWNPFIILHE